jgi:hypothetical protein
VNDRQRVESLFFPMLFKSILESGGRRDEGFEQCRRAIDAASAEILRTLDHKHRASIMRRTYRAHDGAMQPERQGGLSVEKAGMIGFYLLNAILGSGYLELAEDSKVAIAINAVIEALTGFSESPLDASARKQAAKALQQLQRDGYFAGVTMERELA